MAQRCGRCEQYESKQAALSERRVLLWRRGELTDRISEELYLERRRLTEELEKHQAAYHQESIYS
jgi:hypothetical protein